MPKAFLPKIVYRSVRALLLLSGMVFGIQAEQVCNVYFSYHAGDKTTTPTSGGCSFFNISNSVWELQNIVDKGLAVNFNTLLAQPGKAFQASVTVSNPGQYAQYAETISFGDEVLKINVSVAFDHPPQTPVDFTFPNGITVTIDGTDYTGPISFNWDINSQHTIAVKPLPGPQGSVQNLVTWQGGLANPATYTANTTNHSFSFNYNDLVTQYQLTKTVNPSIGGSISPSTNYFNIGSTVQVTANANPGCIFTGWSGDLSGNSNPSSITMSGPRAVTANFQCSSSVTGLGFFPINPCRVVDTRNQTSDSYGAPRLAAGQSRCFRLPGTCGLPPTAKAFSLNATVVPSTGVLGFLTLYSGGTTRPEVSTLNASRGEVVANAAIVPASSDGDICAYATDDTDLVLDVNGFFAPSSATSLTFYPTTPCRVSDTRSQTGPYGGPSLSAGSSRDIFVLNSNCTTSPLAQAFSLNTTAVPKGPLGFVTTWPTGRTMPVVSTLNSQDGRTVANATIVPAGANGGVSAFATDATDLIFDINGYFAPPGTGAMFYHPIGPCRVADTRWAAGALGGPKLGDGATRDFPIQLSSCGVPSEAKAYAFNVTAVPDGAFGHLSLWPAGSNQPNVSTLNSDGRVVANMAIVPAGSDASGSVSVYVTNSANVILDIVGYFAP